MTRSSRKRERRGGIVRLDDLAPRKEILGGSARAVFGQTTAEPPALPGPPGKAPKATGSHLPGPPPDPGRQRDEQQGRAQERDGDAPVQPHQLTGIVGDEEA